MIGYRHNAPQPPGQAIALALLEVARAAYRLEMMRRPPSVADIQARVCHRFRLRPIDMVSKQRPREVARPRQVAMYLCRELTTQSLPQIGRAFHRDHTTVMHACRQIERLRACDAELDGAIRALTAELSPTPQNEARL